MDKKTWQRVEMLFHRALELPDEQRSSFVNQETSDSPVIRHEVLTLLRSHESQTGILNERTRPDWSDAVNELANAMQSQNFAEQQTRDADDSQLIALLETIEPDFAVQRRISRGGMGTVFLVHQQSLNRDVAVKIISRSVIDQRARQRFVRESRAIGQINCDHVVRILDAGLEQSIPYLVMEFIAGPSLRRFIKQRKNVDPKQAANIARQVAVGLRSTHNNKLIHRDVKPANILLEQLVESKIDLMSTVPTSYRAKLIDFGLAREIDPSNIETREQLFAGTLSYMSPEQVANPTGIDHRTDIYSLGMTLYEMLCGVQPFHGATHMVLKMIESTAPTAPRKLDDRIPKDLESICMKAMSKDRQRRYQTADELIDDLSNFLEGRPTKARPVSAIERTRRWISRNPGTTAIIGLVASMLLLVSIGSSIFAWTLANKDREITQQRTLNHQTQIQRILDAQPGALLFAIDELVEGLDGQHADTVKEFQRTVDEPATHSLRKWNSLVALSHIDRPRCKELLAMLDAVVVSPEVCENLVSAIKQDPQAIDILCDDLTNLPSVDPTDEETFVSVAKRKAQRILLLAMLGDFEHWKLAAKDHKNPTLLTEIAHLLPQWHHDLPRILEQVDRAQDPSLAYCLCTGFYLLDQRSLHQSAQQAVIKWAQKQVSQSVPYGAHASAELLLNKWQASQPSKASQKGADWRELSNGMRMVKILPATTTMGRLQSTSNFEGYSPHQVTISRSFEISDTEVTVQQFLEFVNDEDCPESLRLADQWQYSKFVSPSEAHPVQRVSWDDSVRYCNWLSLKKGLTPVYSLNPEPLKVNPENGGSLELESWSIDWQANGFRLPFEHEFELACRQGSETLNFFGVNSRYSEYYILGSHSTRIASAKVRSRLPNRLGLFDTVGNVWEWSNDWNSAINDDPLKDPKGPSSPDLQNIGRIYRGGGISTASGQINSESRGHALPYLRHGNQGFRIARNVDE